MQKLIQILKIQKDVLYDKLVKVIASIENENYSKQLVPKYDELRVLKLRYENQIEHNSIIDGYKEIISNIENDKEQEIVRFILIGKETAFVLYTDKSEKILLGYYNLDI